MTHEGDSAPTLNLPGVSDGQLTEFSLRETTDSGNAVLMLFYPFDFSPVCTTELCAIRDAEWFELTPNLTVWALSGDSAFAHRAFAEEYDLHFPLLSDSNGRVAESYGILYDEWESHERVPKRAVILVDSSRTIQYKWVTDDALEKPDFLPVKEAVDTLAGQYDEVTPEGIDFDVNYS